jgi:hypothetical protein
MSDLIFSLPHETYFGVDIIHRLASVVSRFGDRVLIVTEAILYERNTIEKILELLEKKNISYIVYDEVVPNATSAAVEEALLLARGSAPSRRASRSPTSKFPPPRAIPSCTSTNASSWTRATGAPGSSPPSGTSPRR